MGPHPENLNKTLSCPSFRLVVSFKRNTTTGASEKNNELVYITLFQECTDYSCTEVELSFSKSCLSVEL